MQTYWGDLLFKEKIIRKLLQAKREKIIQQNIVRRKGSSVLAYLLHYEYGLFQEKSSHNLCKAIGFPFWFGNVIETIFSFFPEDEAADWLIELFESVPVSSNLFLFRQRLYMALIDHEDFGAFSCCKDNSDAIALLTKVKIEFEKEFLRKDYTLESQFFHKENRFDFKEFFQNVEDEFNRLIFKTSISFEEKCALLSIQELLLNYLPNFEARAIIFLMSANSGQFSFINQLLHKWKHGYSDFTHAYYVGVGNMVSGLGSRMKHERYIRKIGHWIIDCLKNEKDEISPMKKLDVVGTEWEEAFNDRFRILEFESKTDILEKENLKELSNQYPFPEGIPQDFLHRRKNRLLLHFLKKGTFYSCKCSGLIILILSYFFLFNHKLIYEYIPDFTSFIPENRYSYLVIGAILVIIGRKIISFGRKYKGGDAWYLMNHSKRLIIYFRSFSDDDKIFKRTEQNPFFGIFFPRLTIEEELVNALGKIGDVVTIGNPYTKKMAKGAARLYIEKTEEWEKYAIELMNMCKVSVFNLGYGSSIRNEMAWARQILSPEQVLIHIPFGRSFEFFRYEGQIKSEPFPSLWGEIMNRTFKCNIPWDQTYMHSFFWFKPGWQLRPLPFLKINPSRITGSMQNSYYAALNPVKEYLEKMVEGKKYESEKHSL